MTVNLAPVAEVDVLQIAAMRESLERIGLFRHPLGCCFDIVGR
jgi:hypothetical protein